MLDAHCFHCKHWKGRTCAAFPDGIPSRLRLGPELHFEPREGDHGIQFEQWTPPEPDE